MSIHAYEGHAPRSTTPAPEPAPKKRRAPQLKHRATGRPLGRPNKATLAARALIPAAARAPERYLTPEEQDLSAAAVDTFTKVVGGRQALVDALSIADSGIEADRVVNTLLDPRYNAYTIRQICTLAGITVVELFAAYKKAVLVKAHIEATHLIASKLLPVVEDVMTRAAPVEIVCPSCEGQIPAPDAPPCVVCKGSYLVRQEPDLDRQKLALELGHLTEKKAGLIVQQTQGVIAAGAFTAGGSGVLEQLHQAVGEILFSPSRRRAASPGMGDPVIDLPPTRDDPRETFGQDEPDDPDAVDDEDEDDDAGEEEADDTLSLKDR